VDPVSASADVLTQPLGMNRRERRARRAPHVAPLLAGALGLMAASLAGYVASVDDPLGGEPHALVRVEARAAPPSPFRTVPDPEPEPRQRSAAEVEGASGVKVVRPDGSAPASVIVRAPAEPAALRLEPAPDRRLVERTRYGVLPRVGEDGAKPYQVYARPVSGLPGGARPAARVAVLVGGLGISQTVTADAIAKLPPAVTLAFAPYGSDLDRHVARAREDGHEVMLQVPMEPFDYPDNDPGPHTLLAGAKPQENLDRLHWTMGRVAGYVGLVNFMGARLTADEAALRPILKEAAARGLAFLDDGSSSRSVVRGAAAKAGAPAAQADLVLDGVPRAEAIDRELARLEETARQRGFALGAASALPLTVERLARWSRELEKRGILLVPVSAAFGRS